MTLTNTLVAIAFSMVIGWIGPTLQDRPTPSAEYAWAGACKSCHAKVFESWDKTKHARALGLLSAEEQKQDCVGCHVTGAKTRVMEGSKVLNAGVQCETCHGPALAHVKDPSAKGLVTRVPAEAVCQDCHSEKSPHYKYFFYRGMAPLSHPVK